MKIIVCIKQVPDTSEVRINPETNTLIRDGVPSIINPYDMHAVEAALSIKDELGAEVTVLTMGPPQAEAALRETVAMGADDAVLLTDRAFAGSDTWATAYTLAAAIKFLGADIVLCGKQAIDGDTAQVGPAIAEFMDIPHISYVSQIASVSGDNITVRRLMDEGYDVVEAPLPVLLTVVKELNQPRMASLKGKMRAKKIEIRKLTHKELALDENNLGLKGSPTQVKNIFAPEMKKDRIVIAGTPEEQAGELISILKAIKCI
ncbi:electron transfer flavoprotein subunit beta/FixA family protein [Candidatus Magnetominusculus xianensis]|uniref:Electron transfer flavoprotein subunit beta n=1 Tax=Candidatus Magnetominusculus xianensis TaxID=1748249 RepID=A0ABR5SBB2_9BACT|nr:electron transfer flavoprotein subunit beta/FixA family protein [Candidatus Magnetominusculus xianensis]KWT76834.1 electron transfer flavoprotein subunit beta [Candidatus Magnetominusculus xianensis]MBF0402660.1 electron transfer flavoprotein subunit beta/FixA family protein [Nitrospirota bacterium]